MEQQQKAILESVVSMFCHLHASLNKTTNDSDQEKRAFFRSEAVRLLEEYEADPRSWGSLKEVMPYDDYLLGRKVDGTLTAFDLVRPALKKADFSSEFAYYEHRIRVSTESQKTGNTYSASGQEKTCSVCGETKPANKFRHRGGAVCHACRGKLYRERSAMKTADRADER